MEIWKDVIGYDGVYQISNLGRLKSLKFSIPRIIKNGKYTNGYLSFCLRKGKSKTVSAHRLVAIHFLPNPENKETVNHKNGIKTDNRVENIEWNTWSENHKHAYKNGLKADRRGHKHPTAKLTLQEAKEIKYHTFHLSIKELAQKYNVSEMCIKTIRNKKTWKHI